jgi:hypothetical protein
MSSNKRVVKAQAKKGRPPKDKTTNAANEEHKKDSNPFQFEDQIDFDQSDPNNQNLHDPEEEQYSRNGNHDKNLGSIEGRDN